MIGVTFQVQAVAQLPSTSVLPVPVMPPSRTKSHWAMACSVVSIRKLRIAL
jgi:hypothetical protein